MTLFNAITDLVGQYPLVAADAGIVIMVGLAIWGCYHTKLRRRP